MNTTPVRNRASTLGVDMAKQFGFVTSALPLGIAGLAVMIVGWALTLATAGSVVLAPLGVAMLIGFAAAVRFLARAEASIARSFLGASTGSPVRATPTAGWWNRATAVLTDRAFWNAQLYLTLRIVVGWPAALLAIGFVAAGLGAVTAPIYFRWIPLDAGRPNGLDFSIWQADTTAKACLLVVPGLLVLSIAVALLRPQGRLWARWAEALLAGSPGGACAGIGTTMEPMTVTRSIGAHRRNLLIHAIATVGAAGVLTGIWVAAGSDSFWPGWPMWPLGVALVIHAVVVMIVVRRDHWRRRWMTVPLAVHIGATVAVVGSFIGVWLATGGGYFWPRWIMLAGAVPVAVHWLTVLLRRIDHLEAARAGAVKVQETDLRRIERDLHDGAQARLVALGMNLGLAEQKFDKDPAAARVLVTETREGIGDALRELRDLVRGIRPPILIDRGLEAAIHALADRHPLDVEIRSDIDEPRPQHTVETGAYFVVAEALANAAKHANATRVEIRLQRIGTHLRVEVSDNGIGGAQPTGSGLTGLRLRVEALQGTMNISSPIGGPTVVKADFPCAS
jgi:signal transduction histidine kinase